MATMYFLPELQEYLRERSVIYTVRRYLYNTGSPFVFVPGVGVCKRELVASAITKDKLTPYYEWSGLGTLDSWWDKIVYLNPTLPTLYLYRVTLMRSL